jgi:hypothetical protein
LGGLADIASAFDKNKTMFPEPRREVEFPVGRRIPFPVLLSVFLPEKANMNVASFNFVEIDLVGPSVNGGYVFKKKGLEKSAQQGISPQKILQSLALLGKLLLDAADKNADFIHAWPFRYPSLFKNPSCARYFES